MAHLLMLPQHCDLNKAICLQIIFNINGVPSKCQTLVSTFNSPFPPKKTGTNSIPTCQEVKTEAQRGKVTC